MPIAIDPSKPTEYVLRCDSDAPHDQRTVWQLRGPTVAQVAYLEDQETTVEPETKTIHVNSGTRTLNLLRIGIAGVVRFFGRDGREVPLQTTFNRALGCDAPTDDFLARLTPAWRAELAEEIKRLGTLTDDDRKN